MRCFIALSVGFGTCLGVLGCQQASPLSSPEATSKVAEVKQGFPIYRDGFRGSSGRKWSFQFETLTPNEDRRIVDLLMAGKSPESQRYLNAKGPWGRHYILINRYSDLSSADTVWYRLYRIERDAHRTQIADFLARERITKLAIQPTKEKVVIVMQDASGKSIQTVSDDLQKGKDKIRATQ